MTSTDPSRPFRSALARELRWRPLTRRRLLAELSAHLDDSAADLRAAGLSADDAAAEAASRLGDPKEVAAACQPAGWHRRLKLRGWRLRSPAWIAVGAMSLVTGWAAELPQASGAKATTSAVQARHGLRHGGRKDSRPAVSARGQR